MAKTIFKEGEEVAHIGNIKQKMWVVDILREKKKNKQGMEIGTFLKGIRCHWWYQNILESEKFHSQTLVPWAIAEKGEKEVEKFIHGSPIEA
jgi:uncharacterized protein YodC (DUF2158 family)